MSEKAKGGSSDEQDLYMQALLQKNNETVGETPPHNIPSQALTASASLDQGSMAASNLLFSRQGAEQALLQQRALDSLSFGGGMTGMPGMPGMPGAGMQHQFARTQDSDLLALLSLQLQQQQFQLQQQQQQQMLLQAGSLGGTPFSAAGFLGAGPGAASLLGSPAAAALMGSDPTSSQLFLDSHKQLGDGAANTPASQPDVLSSLSMDRSRRSESFPMTLHRLLADLEAAGASHIATFVAAGDAFFIKNPKLFEERILNKYFPRMGSFGSFQRQLNLYDFKRISTGPQRGAYTHNMFRKAFPQLSKSMKRTKIKGIRKVAKKKVAADQALSEATKTETGESTSIGADSKVDGQEEEDTLEEIEDISGL